MVPFQLLYIALFVFRFWSVGKNYVYRTTLTVFKMPPLITSLSSKVCTFLWFVPSFFIACRFKCFACRFKCFGCRFKCFVCRFHCFAMMAGRCLKSIFLPTSQIILYLPVFFPLFSDASRFRSLAIMAGRWAKLTFLPTSQNILVFLAPAFPRS